MYNSNDPIVAGNENGWWYLKNGKVDFDKKMIFTDPKTGFIYNVINGKATIIKQKDEWELPVL